MRLTLVNSILIKTNRLCHRRHNGRNFLSKLKLSPLPTSSRTYYDFLNEGDELLLSSDKNSHCCYLSNKVRKLSKMSETSQLFSEKLDHYNCITVNSEKENCSLKDFETKLDESLKIWREKDYKAIWFQINIKKSEWVPILAKKGFKFHNAQEEQVTMYLWLPIDYSPNLPNFAHTLVGVGAIVVNDKSQVLVVSEKHYTFPHIKLPGGYVEPNENLVDAAIREVYEETRIQTEFRSLVGFRHTHQGMFKCSDIYFVVALKPLTDVIEMCDKELSMCKWMDVNEYLNDPLVHDLNRFVLRQYLESVKTNIKVDCQHGIHQKLKKPYTVYFVNNGRDTSNKEEPSGSQSKHKM